MPGRTISISFRFFPKAAISFQTGFQKFPSLSKSCKKFPRIVTYQWVTGEGAGKKLLERADRRRRPRRAPRRAAARSATGPLPPDRPISISFSSLPKASISFPGGFQKLPLLSKSCKKFPRIWTYQGVTGDRSGKNLRARRPRKQRRGVRHAPVERVDDQLLPLVFRDPRGARVR